MKTTDIYGLPYIEADDLVSAAPAQFKTMAEGIETALVEVDSRNTPAGVKPVIATTLEALAAQTGVTGQTGYVTADTTTANNGPYFWNGSAWLPYATGGMLDDLRNQLTQGYESAKFTWQNTDSFQPDSYGGGMEIVVDRANRLLHVHLSGFKSTVSLSAGFPVFRYASGPKPSRAVSLGCLWSIPGSNFAKQAKWNTDGSVSVIGGMAVNDRCLHTPRTLPIPAGVTFA